MFGKKEKQEKKERIPDRFVKVAVQKLDSRSSLLYTFVDRYTLVQYTATHLIRGDNETISSLSPILDADGKPLLYQEPEGPETDLDADAETDDLQED